MSLGDGESNKIETSRGPIPIGRALETARKRVQYSEAAAAQALHISERELSHFESGLRTPSADLLDRMSALYGVEAHRFGSRDVVPRVPPRYDAANRVLWVGWTSIKVPDPADDEILLRRLGDALRTMRSLSESQPVYIRSAERPLLSRLLDLEDRNLPINLMTHLGLTHSEAVETVTKLRDGTAEAPVETSSTTARLEAIGPTPG